MSSNDQPATKVDVEEIVTRVIKGATTEILTAVGDQLNTMNDDIDQRFDQLERKVDNITDDLTTRVSKLEKQHI